MERFSKAPSPCFVVEKSKLRRNLATIADVAKRAEVEIIIALKANAMWSLFPTMREYVRGATASSLAEALLVRNDLGVLSHTYAPIYIDREIEQIMECSSHITFNSLSQFNRFGARVILRGISCGLRINPGYSPVKTDIYNPTIEGSRLGIPSEQLTELPNGVDGLHFHTLCESSAEDLATTLEAVEQRFGGLLSQLKWINMGGGHLITDNNYDVEGLISTLQNFKSRYPNLRVILEPGSAFTWNAGVLVTTIEDIVVNSGVGTLMIDASFACHMPDCLEMPYKPDIMGAHDPKRGERGWRIGGNSCLAGDYVGEWALEREPKVGDRIIFEDMIHYTVVKTTMFNGVSHPSIAILEEDGGLRVVREFGYEDYRGRMS